MRMKTRIGIGQPSRSDRATKPSRTRRNQHATLTRIFSKGLAVAFGIVVLAVSLTPASAAVLADKYQFKVRNEKKKGCSSPNIYIMDGN